MFTRTAAFALSALCCLSCLGEIGDVARAPAPLPAIDATDSVANGAVVPLGVPVLTAVAPNGTALLANNAVDGAAQVGDTLPASVGCNQQLSATLTFLNTGTTTWTHAGGVHLEAVGGSDPFVAAGRIELGTNDAVAPGASLTLTLPLRAPSAAGAATTDWQLVRDGAAPFGPVVTRTVAVNCVTQQPPFDLSQITIIGSPDVRGFPITSDVTALTFSPGTIHIDHTKRGQWPPVVIDPTDGTQQEATIWIFFCINGVWYGTGGERLRPSQTDKSLDNPSGIGADWFYDANRWGPMHNYVPQVGELVGFMVVAGSTRADNNVQVQERTGVVLIPFPADGVTSNFPPFFWKE